MPSKSFSLSVLKEMIGMEQHHGHSSLKNQRNSGQSCQDAEGCKNTSSLIHQSKGSCSRGPVGKLSPALKRSLLKDLRQPKGNTISCRSLKRLASIASSQKQGKLDKTRTIDCSHAEQKESHRSLNPFVSSKSHRCTLQKDASCGRSHASDTSSQSLLQEYLDQDDGALQLRGILLERKAEFSKSRTPIKNPVQQFDSDADNDNVSVLSEGDSSIEESLLQSPIKSPEALQSAKHPACDIEQMQDEKEDLARMIAQLELENKEIEDQIERTKNQNKLLQTISETKGSEGKRESESEYKRFIKPSAAFQILPTPVEKKWSPHHGRPTLTTSQMTKYLAQIQSEISHISLNGTKGVHDEQSKGLVVQTQMKQISDQHHDRPTTNSLEFSTSGRSLSSDEFHKAQQRPYLDSDKVDAGDWLIEQIAKRNDGVPPNKAVPFASGQGTDNLFQTESTSTMSTLRHSKAGFNNSNKTQSHSLPQWNAPGSRLPPLYLDEMQHCKEATTSYINLPESDDLDFTSCNSAHKVKDISRPTKADPPEMGTACGMYAQRSMLGSSFTPDPPVETKHVGILSEQPSIPEEDFVVSDTPFPQVISINVVEKFGTDDDISTMSAKERKADKASISTASTRPESVTSHMDHKDASFVDTDSSSEVNEVGVMMEDLEHTDHLLKELYNTACLERREDSTNHTFPQAVLRADDSMHDANQTKKRSKEKKGVAMNKKSRKKLANTKALLERSKRSSQRNVNANVSSIDVNEVVEKTLEFEFSKPETQKPDSTRLMNNNEEKKISRSNRSEEDRTESYSPSRPSTANSLAEQVIDRDRDRSSKNMDRETEIAKLSSEQFDNKSKSHSRSKKSKGRGIKKALSSPSLERKVQSKLSKSSKSNRTKSHSSSPTRSIKDILEDPKSRLRSKSKDRERDKNMAPDLVHQDKAIRRTLKNVRSLEKIDRATKAAKVLERARACRRDLSSEEQKFKRISSRSASGRESRRNKYCDSTSSKGPRRSKSHDMFLDSRNRSSTGDLNRSEHKAKKKSAGKKGKKVETPFCRRESTENISLKVRSMRKASLSPTRRVSNDGFVLEIPNVRSYDDIATSSNGKDAMRTYFEKSRKKDYLSYTLN